MTLQRSARIAAALLTFAAGIVTILATGSGSDTPAPPPTTGSLSVEIGFGAVTSTPYQCTGSASVTITPGSLTGTAGTATAQTQNITFSGMSSTTPNEPACRQTVVFSNLRPGSWTVSSGGASCPATVTAGQFSTVRIWNGACR
jgi:hypothetical protein